MSAALSRQPLNPLFDCYHNPIPEIPYSPIPKFVLRFLLHLPNMPFYEVNTTAPAAEDAKINTPIKIFYRTYGRGLTKVLLITGLSSFFPFDFYFLLELVLMAVKWL